MSLSDLPDLIREAALFPPATTWLEAWEESFTSPEGGILGQVSPPTGTVGEWVTAIRRAVHRTVQSVYLEEDMMTAEQFRDAQ